MHRHTEVFLLILIKLIVRVSLHWLDQIPSNKPVVPSTNLHLRQRRVPGRVDEAELEAVGRHLHVCREDEQHGSLVHVPLSESPSDVSSWWDGERFNSTEHLHPSVQ